MEEILKVLYTGKPLLGTGGLLTQLIKDLTQIALQGEINAHPSEETALEEVGNRRNDISQKTTKRTSGGSFELESPRDRNGSFSHS